MATNGSITAASASTIAGHDDRQTHVASPGMKIRMGGTDARSCYIDRRSCQWHCPAKTAVAGFSALLVIQRVAAYNNWHHYHHVWQLPSRQPVLSEACPGRPGSGWAAVHGRRAMLRNELLSSRELRAHAPGSSHARLLARGGRDSCRPCFAKQHRYEQSCADCE